MSKNLADEAKDKGIRYLIQMGVTEFTEVGYGNMLTKFGMFINRKVEFKVYTK